MVSFRQKYNMYTKLKTEASRTNLQFWPRNWQDILSKQNMATTVASIALPMLIDWKIGVSGLMAAASATERPPNSADY